MKVFQRFLLGIKIKTQQQKKTKHYKPTLISSFMLCISDLALRNSNNASSRSFSAFSKIFVIFPEGENPFACLRRSR